MSMYGGGMEIFMSNFIEKATPESCGVSSVDVIKFVEGICQGLPNQETHSFMLIRHGKLLFEGYFSPYNEETEHSLFSVSKSFASTAIGYLVSEGKVKVEDSISDYFPELINDDINKDNLKITIHDLLSMSFGQQGGAVHESQKRNDMCDVMLYDFFYRKKDIECGKLFRYDSYGTYMLSALINKLTGKTVVEYLMPKLFEPLDIKQPYYIKDELGISVGYTGMRLRLQDLAKVGLTYLNGGVWNGKQVIPSEWINLATQKHIPTDGCATGPDWQEGYCYQFWKGRHNTYRFCGAYGQMCVMMPEYDAVFVINSGYDNDKLSYVLDTFYKNIMFNMKNTPLPEDKDSNDKLNEILDDLCLTYQFSEMSPMAKLINGKTYKISPKGGYDSIEFNFTNETVIVKLSGESESYTFEAGFNKPVWGRTERTHFASLENKDCSDTVGTACWQTKKDLEITLRLIGTPSMFKIVADFSAEPDVSIVTYRCKF